MNSTVEFRKLVAASFISQVGSHFLTLALSTFILLKTGSPVQAALVFVFSYLPAVLFSSRLGPWIDGNISKKLLIGNEFASVIATLVCTVSIALHLSIVVLCALLGVRSILLFIGRSSGIKWVKAISAGEIQAARFKIFYLGLFLSTAVSGLLAAFALKFASIWIIASLDVGSYLLGIAVYSLLKPLDFSPVISSFRASNPRVDFFASFRAIFERKEIRTSFLIVCLSQAAFQGAYSAFVAYFPVQVYNLGLSGVGLFQISASIGITAGFLINWFAPLALTEKNSMHPKKASAVAVAAFTFLLIASSGGSAAVGLSSFLMMNLAYEWIWLQHNSDFFRESPSDKAAQFQFTLSSFSAFLMSLLTLGYASSVTTFGPMMGTLAVAASFLILIFSALLLLSDRRKISIAMPEKSLT